MRSKNSPTAIRQPFMPVVASLLVCVSCAVQAACAASATARLGINLSGHADYATEHPFVDVYKQSRTWISQREGAAWGKGPALDLDENGWVKKLEPGCRAETPMLTAGHAPSGDYLCLYDGEGEIAFWPDKVCRVVSQKPGRIVVNIDGKTGGVFLSLRRTNPDNPIRNIRLIMPGFEETFQQEPFHPAFLARWRGCDTLRFMDWQDTNNSEQREWRDRPRTNSATFTVRGAPAEVMVDLCNRQKANPWFCLPHQATDDYVRQFAQLVKQRLDPSLRVYIELSNEVWNGIFGQHRYAVEQAKQLKLGTADRPWEGAALFYARRSVEVFRIWEDVFSGRDRLVRVISWQAAGGEYWTDKMLLAQADTAKQCDALAIAPYISMILGPNSKPKAEEAARWSVEEVLEFAQTNALPQSLRWIQTQKKVADKYGMKLVCYEAGQHLVGSGGGENSEALTALFIAANRHPRMGAIYTTYLDAWRNAGGDLMCLFSSVSAPSKWGSWGLLEAADKAGSPKFDAVIQWKTEN